MYRYVLGALSVTQTFEFSLPFALATVFFSEQIMSADKNPSIFSRQKEDNAYI